MSNRANHNAGRNSGGSPKASRRVGNDGTVFKCPICKAILPGTGVASFPFCSDRCRMMDLSNWMDGKYSISRPVDPTDLDEMDQAPAPRRLPPQGGGAGEVSG